MLKIRPSAWQRVRAALVPALLAGSAPAAPLVDCSFEAIERGGRFDLGPVAFQPRLERDGTEVPTDLKRWLPVGTPGLATVVEVPDAPRGERALAFAGPTAVERPIPATTLEIVWVEGWHRGPGGARTLAQADYPGAADGFPAAAIVHFSAANGIELLDGDGSGGGTPVRTGRPAGRSGQSQWTRVTLRLDYDTRTWECYLDGEKAHPGSLGFRDNGATLQALRLQAGATGEADAFRVLAPLRGDANVDGVVDAADLVRARQYLSFDPSTYDIIGVLNVSESNATDGEGRPVVTESDLAALRQRILAGP